MDRVRALVEKLNAQLHQNEDKANLMITAQQILTELGGAVSAKPLPQNIYQEIAIELSDMPAFPIQIVPEIQKAASIVEIPAASNTEVPETIVVKIPAAIIESNSQIPIAETSIPIESEMFKETLDNSHEKIEKKEVKDHIVLEPIKDLRSAIGINDKFQFIQELFGGDEKSFEVGVKTINSFKIFPEAQFYIKKELREKNNWDDESNVVKQFDQLVKRRFS